MLDTTQLEGSETTVGTRTPPLIPEGQGRRRRRFENNVSDGRQKVSDELMAYLVGEGYSGPEIVQILKDDYGIDYTKAGVSKWRNKHNIPARPRTASQEKLIPWRVLEQDAQHRLVKFLRTEARLREGLDVDEPSLMRHRAVLQELTALDVVIYYDQDNGFVLVAPRPGIDDPEDFIYNPRVDDDGDPIEDRALWQ